MTTPFTPTAVTYPGQDPGVELAWRSETMRFWLGRPDQMMIELPTADPGDYEAAASLGEVEHGLLGGTSGLTIFDSATRRWTISWPRLVGRDWQVVNGFYRRLFGNDPWAFLPPEDLNRLTLAQSMCGGLHDVAEGWAATVGTLTYASAVTAPVYPCGVLQWAGAGLNSQMVAGLVTGGVAAVDVDRSMPYVAAESVTGFAYVAKASGTVSARVQLLGLSAAGALVATINGTTTALTTTLTQLSVTAAPGALGASAYVLLVVQSLTAAAPNILVSCASLSKLAGVPEWAAGGGAPRVNLVQPVGRRLDTFMNNAATMTLAEVITGGA